MSLCGNFECREKEMTEMLGMLFFREKDKMGCNLGNKEKNISSNDLYCE